ncbi:hypothetical protein BH686_01935 [Rhodococcus erythropolis]|nr:hypothetical protein BH686_01935 [Rhodococcus erythropolis]
MDQTVFGVPAKRCESLGAQDETFDFKAAFWAILCAPDRMPLEHRRESPERTRQSALPARQ